MAKELFDIAVVGAAMATAAAEGETQFLIAPPEPFDLQATAAAIALTYLLKKGVHAAGSHKRACSGRKSRRLSASWCGWSLAPRRRYPIPLSGKCLDKYEFILIK